MLYAKSQPEESIFEHTEKLLENLELLKNTYGYNILENKSFNNDFWKLLKVICKYHDFGKVYTPFQNIILNKLNKKEIQSKFNYDCIKHEQISPMFVPINDLSKDEKKLVYQAIFYHHERIRDDISKKLVDEIIKEDIIPRINTIKKEIPYIIKEELNSIYLGYVGSRKKINENDEIYIEYCLLKGLLYRLDHSSSAGIKIENNTKESLSNYTEDFVINNYSKINALQKYCKENSNDSIIIIGSTGIGKTEAASIWANNSKMFFTLPVRISINAIYDRMSQLIKYKHVGLLHSLAVEYLEEKEEEFEYSKYEETKNLCEKVTICTIDQIFPFVFKYKGYEKMYATLSYSKVVIDEIQAYSPEITAIILKGIEMINKIGGKFMIMTATLPRIYKEELEKMGINFKYDKFLKDTKRHRIKIKEQNIVDEINSIVEKSKNSKVLVILNTINKANEVFNKLKECGVEKINLLHSRFIQKDRSEKENLIKKFSNNRQENGIWITTQIVEASLDIDFDYLYTEMSTLDSLFQRLGRCYRSREYLKKDPNIYIFTENNSGIKYVYDEDIHKLSIELLKKYDTQILSENVKVELVDRLYSKELIKDTEFYKKFSNGINVLNNISDSEVSKTEAQKLLRKIDNVTVIPKSLYDCNIDLFCEYEELIKQKDYSKANIIKRKINKLCTSISVSQAYAVKEYITKNDYNIKEIKVVDLKYDNEIGLRLKSNSEYELENKFL